jgi:para-aminobenzoate synthetase component 1
VPDSAPFVREADSYLTVPLSLTAEAAFACFAADPHVAWLESRGPISPRSRYSYLAVEPFAVIEGAPAFDRLAAAMRGREQPAGLAPTPFGGGAAGFLGYELGATLERLPHHRLPPGLPPCSIGLYDVVLAFDRAEGRAWLIASSPTEAQRERRAQHVLARMAKHCAAISAQIRLEWQAEATRTGHEARVERAIAYIEAGDIYQANITAAFHAARPAALPSADIHLALRAANPAPFTAYVGAGPGCAVASVSPERFLSLDANGGIEARPIKGTRPRHADPARDAALRAELLASAKDQAENLMIVDLLRHDISRVAEIGSVHVPELAALESFASVHHLVSSVRGQLRAGLTATDLLRATFPGGSITGAPKLRAQEIIHELEPTARGAYCGAVFWMGWDGAMDSSIAIRTATITPDRVTLQAGGGIVADSDPAEEYEELMVKIRPLLRALGPWEG